MTIMKDITDAIEEVSKELHAMREEATVKDSEHEALVNRLDAFEEKKQELDVMLNQSKRLYIPGLDVVGPEQGHEQRKDMFSYGRAVKVITGYASKRKSQAAYDECKLERDVFETMEASFDEMPAEMKAAMSMASDGAGAFLMPLNVMDEIIPVFDAAMISAKLGVTRIDGLVGTLAWPKDEGGIAAQYLDTEEEETMTETLNTFSSVDMKPHVLVAAVPLTWGMITQSSIAIEKWVRNRIATQIALKEDESVFIGLGASTPRGITNVSGISQFDWATDNTQGDDAQYGYGTAGQNITSGLRLTEKVLAESNALATATKLGWAASPAAAYAIGTTIDDDHHHIFGGDNAAAFPTSLLGRPLENSTQLNQSDTDDFLLFGDFAKCINAHWGTMAFAASGEHDLNFLKLRTTIRAVTAHDIAILQDAAFCEAVNFGTNATEV